MKTVVTNLLSLFILLFTANSAHAIPTDFQDWTQVTAHVSLNKEKTRQLYFEVQPRVGDHWQRMERLLLLPAFVYNVHPDLRLYLGYTWAPLFMDSHYHRDYRNENRIWQQIVYRQSFLDLQWQHRLRQEQRFIDRTDGVSNRLRYQLRASYPLARGGDYGLTGFNEIFVNLNSVDRGPSGGYDRDRFFMGPYWTVDNARYEVGYVGEHARIFGSGERYINALMVSANFSF